MKFTIETPGKETYTDVLGHWDSYFTTDENIETEQEVKTAHILGRHVQEIVRTGVLGDPTQPVKAKVKVTDKKVTIEVSV